MLTSESKKTGSMRRPSHSMRKQDLRAQDAATPVSLWAAGWQSGAPLIPVSGQQFSHLHGAYGNQAILRTLQHSTPAIQTKLTVNQPGDVYEQEADRVADQVMRMPANAAVQRRCSACAQEERVQRKCAHCEDEEKQEIHRKESGAGTESAPPIVDDVLRSPGQPLGAAARAFMEPRFGYDFGDVRIHTDEKAAESARAVNALAYTVGHQVVFDAGQYSPTSFAGKRLLAHELSHVMQQGQGHRLQRDKKEQPAPKTDAPPQAAAGGASAGAVKALASAQKMMDQTDPAVWFDSWGNDLRDNNLDGKIDDGTEQGLSDGSHYNKIFDAKICKTPTDTTDTCPASDQSATKVVYKVCIDVPIEAYQAAGISISTNRWIPTFFRELQKNPNWTVWKSPAQPANLLDGDIVAADNAEHGHAGIVSTGLLDSVINLPGPTAARKYKVYFPSGKNDIKSVPRLLFESFLGIDWVARSNK